MEKRCAKCGNDQPLSLFNKDRTRTGGLYHTCNVCRKAYRDANIARENARSAVWRKANPSASSDYKKANDAATREYNAAYYRADVARGRGRVREWQIANPAHVKAQKARRRAVEVSAPGRGITAEELRSLGVGSVGVCAYCSKPKRLTLDHIVPLSKGGAHEIENAAACCYSCNSAKRDKVLVVWLAERAA